MGSSVANAIKREMNMTDIYRIDNTAPSASYPYRVKVNGKLLTNADGSVRKFRTLDEAHRAVGSFAIGAL